MLIYDSLSKTRRKRPVPEDWATGENVQEFQPVETSEPLYPGGKAVSLDSTGDLALVGGTDGVAAVYSLSQKNVVATLKAGSGPVTDSTWVGNKAAIATSSGTVKVFENGAEVASFDSHAGEVTALAAHPSGDIFASVGVDKSYVLYDLTSNSVLTQIFTDSGMHSSFAIYSLLRVTNLKSRPHLHTFPSRRTSACSRRSKRSNQVFRHQIRNGS